MVAQNVSALPPPEPGRFASIDREVPLSRGRYLRDRQHEHRGRLSGFSLQLAATIAGRREPIARIDTHDGTIRMHTFARGGVEEIETIETVPADAPADFLDTAYLAAYDYLVSGASRLIKAWEGERPFAPNLRPTVVDFPRTGDTAEFRR